MTKDERLEKIRALERARGSRVLAYLTADRGIAAMQIAEDVLRIAYDHVRSMGQAPKLDLLIYSRGGDAMLPWPLVTTLRSFCGEFAVLVPFKAHSAATLIALGADEIVMTPIAQLTPVEPTVKMPFNPADPSNPGQQLGINVEDVVNYFDFVADRAGITGEEGKTAALGALTANVNPIALGNLHRSHKLAAHQAEKLLSLHMDQATQNGEIREIVDNVIKRLWAHEYKIGRTEARSLGLNAVDPPEGVESALWDTFVAYEESLELRNPIIPVNVFSPGQGRATLNDVKLVYVESTERSDVFLADFDITRPLAATPTQPGQPPQFGPQVQITVTQQRWDTE